jgi:hypothetical protein
MSKRRQLPQLKIAPRVTVKDGEAFADEWLETGAAFDAFQAAGLIEWPQGELGDPRHERFQDIEDEILDLTFADVRPAVVAAFVKAARRVLARERRRG